jgi:hypothetical protein
MRPPRAPQDGGRCAGAPGGACVTFAAALTDPAVSTIYLDTNVTLAPGAFANFTSAPYLLTRNLTVASAPGTWRALDFAFIPARAAVAPGLALVFENMTMLNPR